MKRIMGLLLLLVTVTSNAGVVDSFKCEAQIEDMLTGQKTSSSNSFDVLRKPIMSDGPFETDIWTLGQSNLNLSLATKNYVISTVLQISYEHAARKINGIMDARQSECTYVSTSFCDTSSEDGGICEAASSGFCLSHTDPFDPIKGWGQVPFINGAPGFDDSFLRSSKIDIKNNAGITVAKYSSNCVHTGTTVDVQQVQP
jgi:hypothetical protein